jgi:hypothetical protein
MEQWTAFFDNSNKPRIGILARIGDNHCTGKLGFHFNNAVDFGRKTADASTGWQPFRITGGMLIYLDRWCLNQPSGSYDARLPLRGLWLRAELGQHDSDKEEINDEHLNTPAFGGCFFYNFFSLHHHYIQ